MVDKRDSLIVLLCVVVTTLGFSLIHYALREKSSLS